MDTSDRSKEPGDDFLFKAACGFTVGLVIVAIVAYLIYLVSF